MSDRKHDLQPPPPPDLHLVQNCSGTDRGGGGVLAIQHPIPSPPSTVNSFQRGSWKTKNEEIIWSSENLHA